LRAGRFYGFGKYIALGCGVLLILGLMAGTSFYFLAGWAKQKAAAVAAGWGWGGGGETYGPALARKSDVCGLLPGEELSRIIGVAVARVSPAGNSCRYFGDAPPSGGKSGTRAGEVLEQLRKAEPKALEGARALIDQLGKEAAGATADLVSGHMGDHLLEVTVNWGEARTSEPAFKTMVAAAPGAYGQPLENAAGAGDRVYAVPLGAGLRIVKGDTWIELSMPPAGSRTAAIEIARKIVSRL
jgi:hypothetical protein